MIENQKKRDMEINEIFYINFHLIDGLEWNSQLAKSSWCPGERWHHLLDVTHIATL